MYSGLGSLFKKLSETVPKASEFSKTIRTGETSFVEEYKQLETSILSSLKTSPALKILVYTDDIFDLWKFPGIGLVLYDVLVFTGGKTVSVSQSDFFKTMAYSVSEALRSGSLFFPWYYSFFENEQIKKWFKEAENFVSDGRLIYLPSKHQLIYDLDKEKKGFINFRHPLDPRWSFLDALSTTKEIDSHLFSFLDHKLICQKEYFEILNISLPFIEGISLKLLHKIMKDEYASLLEFRKAVTETISKYLNSLKTEKEIAKIGKIGAEIKRDIADPEIAKLNRLYRKILRTRSIKIAGAAIGTLSLEIAAFFSDDLISSFTQILGAGGLGILAKEYSDYHSDLYSLKDSTWYFAWHLKSKAKK